MFELVANCSEQTANQNTNIAAEVCKVARKRTSGLTVTVTQIVILSVSFIPFFQAIHDKDIVAILHLLVALARHFECPLKLPGGVRINIVVVQKKGGILLPQKLVQEITATTEGEE